MRCTLASTALLVALHLATRTAAAQSVDAPVPPPPRTTANAVATPIALAPAARATDRWVERYANGSISLLGGFGVQHEPYAGQGASDFLGIVSSARFVVVNGLVIEPEFSAFYGAYAPVSGGTTQTVGTFGVRPGLRVGYTRALGERIALTVEGGYRLDRREQFDGSYRAPAAYSHGLLALAGATIFLSRNFFLEESVTATVEFHEHGVGFAGGVSSAVGVTF